MTDKVAKQDSQKQTSRKTFAFTTATQRAAYVRNHLTHLNVNNF